MSKILKLFIISLIIIQSIYSQNIEYTYKLGASKSIGFRDLYECSNGDYVIAADIDSSTIKSGILRLDQFGQVQWAKSLQFDTTVGSCSFQVIEGQNNSLFLNGLNSKNTANSAYDMSMFITNLDSQGNINWSKEYNMGSGLYAINQMKLLNNDTLLSLASVFNKIVIIKTAPNGDLIFGKTITTDTLGSAKNPGFDVVQLSNSNILVTSKIGVSFMAILMDNLGQTIWTKTYQVGKYIRAHSIIETSSNQVFISGFLSPSNSTVRTFIMKFNPTVGNIDTIITIGVGNPINPGLTSLSVKDNNLILIDNNQGNSKVTVSEFDFNLIPLVSYTNISGYQASKYHKTHYNNKMILYGSTTNMGVESGSFIETNNRLDSSCLFDSINIITQPFTDYSIDSSYQYFETPYTFDKPINITTNNLNITRSNTCNLVSIKNEKINNNKQVVIYPNPSRNKITLKGIQDKFDLYIYNSIGKILYSEMNITDVSKPFDVCNYPNGIIFVKVVSNNKTHFLKFIKE